MTHSLKDQRIQRAAVVAAASLVALLVATAVYTARLRPEQVAKSAGYVVGETIEFPQLLDVDSRLSVIMFVRGSCPACERALPVFDVLVRRAQEHRDVNVRVVTPRGSPMNEQIAFAGLGLTPEAFYELSQGEARVNIVPTILAVDRERRVRFVHQGGAPTVDSLSELFDLFKRSDSF
jgi:thiol-disulfide isomerase/thioredoxin